MSHLFISYRRNDSGPFADTLHKALSLKLGKNNVVFDKVSIPPGVDFRDYLSRRIRDCDIVLAVIGTGWKTAEKEGQRRLEQHDDPLLAELEIALQANKHVMPVLIHGAEMPVEKDLPSTLKTLAYKNAFRFESESSFDSDLKTLLEAIHEYRLPKKVIRRLAWILAGFVALTLVLALSTAWLWLATTEANSVEGTKANLGRFDKDIFVRRGNEDVKVARAFPDRDALDKASSIKDQFLSARQSFDLFIFSGKALAESETAMIEAAERGVRMRVVMVDHSPKNQDNVARYLSMLERSGRPLEWYRANFQSTMGILQRVQESANRDPQGKGRLEIRTFTGPFSSSFWVRDAGIKNHAAAHIAITLYGDDRKFPAVRFGELSGEVVDNLAGQFEYLWTRSREVIAD